jgi:hypothetical protein
LVKAGVAEQVDLRFDVARSLDASHKVRSSQDVVTLGALNVGLGEPFRAWLYLEPCGSFECVPELRADVTRITQFKASNSLDDWYARWVDDRCRTLLSGPGWMVHATGSGLRHIVQSTEATQLHERGR